MPAPFKIGVPRTDAPDMNESAVDDSLADFLTDGDVPRLAPARPILQNLPPPSVFDDDPVNPLGLPSPVLEQASLGNLPLTLPSPSVDAVPVLTSLTGPSLPSSIPEATDDSGDDATDAPVIHPMAHLMPERSKPSEARDRANAARAAKKAKARKIKIGVIAGLVVFAAVVGPPLGKWLVDAINAEGSSGKPAVEQPAETTLAP